MHKDKALICLSCNEVHEGWECPKCAKGPSYHITTWIDQAIERRKEEQHERPEGD